MKNKEIPDIDWFKFDTDFYDLIQKHFKVELNQDENLFNWYCELRDKLEIQIIKQQKGTE
jgi:hypothetical protein